MVWHFAMEESGLGEGEVLGVIVGGEDVALYRANAKIYATSNICSHGAAFLSDGYLDGECIECPLHRAQFDIRTGAALCEPAETPIATYPVRLESGRILVDIPDAP